MDQFQATSGDYAWSTASDARRAADANSAKIAEMERRIDVLERAYKRLVHDVSRTLSRSLPSR